MEQTKVQKLAQVLWVLVIVVFVCNLIVLTLIPGLVCFQSLQIHWADVVQEVTEGGTFVFEEAESGALLGFYILLFFCGYAEVWLDAYTAVLTLFLWACGICTAIILWQGKRVLDTILWGEPFSLANAANLRRAAVCCFVISGAALARTIWGMVYYHSIGPLLTYNALFVPVFLLAGLLCMVMSALFRQAAELKADNDLTI